MPVCPDLTVERSLLTGDVCALAAVDEVGRGAIAGPVTVGAVMVTDAAAEQPAGLRDSKLLTPAARGRLVEPIRTWVAGWAVGHAEPDEIDRLGIMGALRLAALRALAALPGGVDVVLLDGNVDYLAAGAEEPVLLSAGLGTDTPRTVTPAAMAVPVVTRVKGDRDCASVAAASVLAKVSRDVLMEGLHGRFPQYEWARNKGYGTAAHAAAIRRHGTCEQHRRSWNLPERGDVAPAGAHGG